MEMDELRAAAERELRKVASKSQRTGNVPFPPDFVIAKEGQDGRAPLARMIQGGQGGSVRLRLYLCITMMATKEPFNLRKPPTPKAWARMLNLDPEKGDRRVQRNLKWLAENNFIKLEQRWGGPAEIRLLSAAATGVSTSAPSSSGTTAVGMWAFQQSSGRRAGSWNCRRQR